MHPFNIFSWHISSLSLLLLNFAKWHQLYIHLCIFLICLHVATLTCSFICAFFRVDIEYSSSSRSSGGFRGGRASAPDSENDTVLWRRHRQLLAVTVKNALHNTRTDCFLTALECTKFVFGRRWGSVQRYRRPPSWFEVALLLRGRRGEGNAP